MPNNSGKLDVAVHKPI